MTGAARDAASVSAGATPRAPLASRQPTSIESAGSSNELPCELSSVGTGFSVGRALEVVEN